MMFVDQFIRLLHDRPKLFKQFQTLIPAIAVNQVLRQLTQLYRKVVEILGIVGHWFAVLTTQYRGALACSRGVEV